MVRRGTAVRGERQGTLNLSLRRRMKPADREAFNRAVRALTERSAKLVDEVAQNGDLVEDDT